MAPPRLSPHPAQLYLSPALKLSEAELGAFVAEADAMLHFLATGGGGDALEVRAAC